MVEPETIPSQRRYTERTIIGCPLTQSNSDLVDELLGFVKTTTSLDECKKCPHNISANWKFIDCTNLTEKEKKLLPEPTVDKEFTSKW